MLYFRRGVEYATQLRNERRGLVLTIPGYKAVEKIYTGTHLETYRALQIDEKRSVILKTTRNKSPPVHLISALRQEYDLLKRLEVKGLVRAYALIKYEKTWVQVLEDMGGITL